MRIMNDNHVMMTATKDNDNGSENDDDFILSQANLIRVQNHLKSGRERYEDKSVLWGAGEISK